MENNDFNFSVEDIERFISENIPDVEVGESLVKGKGFLLPKRDFMVAMNQIMKKQRNTGMRGIFHQLADWQKKQDENIQDYNPKNGLKLKDIEDVFKVLEKSKPAEPLRGINIKHLDRRTDAFGNVYMSQEEKVKFDAVSAEMAKIESDLWLKSGKPYRGSNVDDLFRFGFGDPDYVGFTPEIFKAALPKPFTRKDLTAPMIFGTSGEINKGESNYNKMWNDAFPFYNSTAPILKGRRGEWLMSEELKHDLRYANDFVRCYQDSWYKTTKKDMIDIYGYRADVKFREFKYINFKNYIK